ncbi:MAG TPA: tetratricopeptide repeat protein [Chroococcidiopsis sp.]
MRTSAIRNPWGLIAAGLMVVGAGIGDRIGVASAQIVPSLLTAQRPSSNLVQLYRTGQQQYTQGQFRDALATFQQVLDEVRSAGLRREEGLVLSDIGMVYSALSDYDQAIAFTQQALAIHREVGNRTSEGTALNNIGLIYSSRGQYAEALEAFQQALPIHRETGNRAAEGTTLNNIGLVYSDQGNYDQALDAFEQALGIEREVNNRLVEGTTLNNIAFVNERLGRYPQALEFYRQALAIHQETGNRAGQGYVLSNSGNVYFNSGDYAQALDRYQQASAIAREIGDRALEGQTYNNIGLTYERLGQYTEALAVYQQALAIHRDIGNRRAEGEVLQYTGSTYVGLGQYQQALEASQQSLAIRRQLGDRPGEGVTLNNIGLIYDYLGQYQQALEFYQQSLELARTLGNRATEGVTLNNMGLIYTKLGQSSQALASYQQSLSIFQSLGDRPGERIALGNMGMLLAAQDQPELAIVFFKQAVNITESIRQNLQTLSQEQQQSYTTTVADTYRRLADLLLQQDRVLEAQQVLDLLKLQELEDYLRDVRGNAQTAKGVDFWAPETELFDRYRQFSAIASSSTDASARNFSDFLNDPQVQGLVEQLRRTARGQVPNPEILVRLQAQLANVDHAVLLYPFVLDDRLELVLVPSRGEPIRRTVPVTRTQLNRAIVDFRTELTSRSRQTAAARQLYDWLIRPLEADLAETETIILASDGQLRYVPLAALYDGNQWLIQRFTVNYITAASITDFSTRPLDPSQVRVLAGAFDAGDKYGFNGLPSSRVEVETIAAEIPNTTVFFNRAFSRDAIVPHMNDYTVVHLATHAEFVPGAPEQSFILFGNGDRVTLRDMSEWSLPNVELVVLSACRTAVGSDLGNGEEILGFGYQIQRARARAAIASLWYVDDRGSQTLMTAFYGALSQGLTEAAALRQAQIALITGDFSHVSPPGAIAAPASAANSPAQPQLSHPYYWAPFILIGNGL